MASKKKKLPISADKSIQKAQPQQVVSGTNKANYFFAFLLILATVVLYGHSLNYPLVFDDEHVFVDANLERLGSSLFHLDLRWFSYASFGWTYNLFGLDWFWYRLGNLGLHALTGILLFIFFSRLLDASTQSQDALAKPHWPAFFAALVFVLHPVAVYGVAYLVQRSIIMATMFGIAALLCYMEGLMRDKPKWFVLSALCYFLAVFSKEHSIMIPGVAAALTLLLHKPSFALLRKVWLPFTLYLVIAVLIVLRTKDLLGGAYEPRAADMLAQLSEHQVDIPIANVYPLSIITQGYLFFQYLLLWIIPNVGWMSVDIRQPFAAHFLSWPHLPGFILFLAYPLLTIKLLLKGGKQGLLGFGLLFPWILFLTELASVRIQEPFVLYRSYLWMSGLPIVMFGFMGVTPKKSVPALLAVFCVVLASLAWNRLDTFSSDLNLWSDAIAKNKNEKLPDTRRAYNNRAVAYEELGRYSEALADYKKTAEINPKYPEDHKNIAHMQFKLDNLQEALREYNTAIQLKPDYIEAYISRGDIFSKMGHYLEAFQDFNRVIQLGQEDRLSYSNRGAANFNLEKFQEALNDYDKALSFDTKDSQAMFYRGVALFKLNRKQEAKESLRRSCDAGNQGACAALTQITSAQ